MKYGKIVTVLMVLVAVIMAVSVIVMHSVEASTSTDDEVTENINNENGKENNSEDDNMESYLLLAGVFLIVVIITLVAIYLSIRKTQPLPTEERVVPDFIPISDNYNHEAWGDSDSTWSHVNAAWEAHHESEQGLQYGSYKQQYQSLYASKSEY
jgi:hypothetical protein